MNLTINKPTLVFLTLVLSYSIGFASGDYEAGEKKSKSLACIGCHGATGQSQDPQHPNLGGQHESYIIQALIDYKKRYRNNVIMSAIADTLSKQDIADIAAFYSAQEGLFTPTKDQW